HARHPHCRLVVVGHCEPDFAKAADIISASAVLTGFVSDDALCSLYHSAELVWFPSLYEGFGMPVLEAMACGTGVVTCNSSSLPEVAGDAAVLVSPTNVAEHVEAIDSLLKDLELREELSRRGKARAQQFTWQRTASQLREHFLSLT
ncbi:MAG: glycosyltransferase family 4 protein, partial [Halobacteriota archaeon]